MPAAVEIILWAVVVGLVSPLVWFSGAGWMPLWALYGIAAGIVLALALIGRRLHAAMLSDALSGRQGVGRLLWTAGMVLLAAFLVLVGAVVAIVAVVRSKAPVPPF